ncbi:hypothetical protein TNCV_1040511 [Trichonephila clavipes]|nr:hypothetical protein TNCV_1040511 [Trichonephila clavipes]
MDAILTTARDLELDVNEDDIEKLIMGHENELTIELQNILNEEHEETQRNVSPSGPVYMDEKCRQNTGTNPLCTRLHGDPAKSRVEMQVHFSYPLSTRNFGGKKESVF